MRVAICVLVFFCTLDTASAQEALTEAAAVARLSPNSPHVRALQATVALAEAEVAAAARLPNPRVTFSREAVSGVAERYGLVGLPLPVTGRRGLEVDAARARARASSFEVSDLRRRAEADVRRTWVDLREGETRELEIAGTVQALRGLAEILRRREREGDVAGFDRLRIEREVLDVEANLADATAARIAAQAALALFFPAGTDPLTLRTATVPGPERDLPPGDALLARALESRGVLRSLQQQAEAARLDADAAARRLWPEPEIVAGVKTSGAGAGTPGSVLSVAATLPLFDRLTPERDRARARGEMARAEFDRVRTKVEVDVLSLRAIVAARRSAADGYRQQALSRSLELQRIARVSYDNGERSVMELLDTYRTALDARVRLAELDAAVRGAEIELEFASAWETLR